jgi:hypothetical protein
MISQLDKDRELVIILNHMTKMIYRIQEQLDEIKEKK